MKSGLVRPYEDGQFTYHIGDMVVMGHFFEKVKKHGGHIIYRYFMHEYISCQYNHLVVVAWISLTKIKAKAGETRRWKITESDHECIMETCTPNTHWPYEYMMQMEICEAEYAAIKCNLI